MIEKLISDGVNDALEKALRGKGEAMPKAILVIEGPNGVQLELTVTFNARKLEAPKSPGLCNCGTTKLSIFNHKETCPYRAEYKGDSK